MKDSKKIKSGSFHLEHYVWGVPLLWTLVIATSLVWNVIYTKQMVLEEGRIQARVAFKKDIIYRHWIAKHGGVYVPVTEETQPNPYLSHLPERDITTPSGKLLTLMNPAYMTRQVYELAKEEYGILDGHITSLNPIRSENAPDPWEINALQAFERGETEINSVEKMEGKDYMRLMLPLITEKACLKCHAAQGYREKDIRGGISVSIPMEPLWAIERKSIQMLALVHILIWLVGLGGIGLATVWLKKSEQERKRAEEQLQKAYAELEQRVIERTAELRAINESLQKEITDREQAEETLRESEERYRNILGNIEDGYYEVDNAGSFTFYNNSLCKILGYSKEEMMGMNNRHYMDKETAPRVYQAFNQVYTTGEPLKAFVYKIIRKDGTERFLESHVSLLRNAKGERIGFRGIARDITERKQTEEEMAALHEQLRQSQKMEAIGQLAGGIAHDFNNLLTLITGYSQLSLTDLREDDPLRESINQIKNAGERAANLTRQLLAFSRRQVMEMRVLDLNTLLRDLDKMLRRIIGEDIDLVTLLAEDLGRVKVDPGQIEQVVMNLAVNGRDAMPKGGKLTVETCNVELEEAYARKHVAVTPGRYVMFSISDAGAGMTPEVRERIFEPFFTTKEKGKGTGLGLSTVYGIVKQSGGNIWVYSEPGHGTTFKIYLPMVEEELDTLHGRDEADSSPMGSETVLLVEDEPLVRDLAHRILSQQGYKVLEAANGEEALCVAREHAGEKIHLLFTDVVMPQMGGKDLADQLKILRPDIKVLYASGYTDNAIVHHGVLERGTHFLQKPFSPKALSQKVREVLDR